MSPSSPALNVLRRTQEVVAYQRDPALRGRPIGTMLAGGVLAIVAAVLCARLCYAIWYLHTVEVSYGFYGVSFLFALFVLGAYFFALGYELYDVPRAVRLTLVFAVFGILALAFIIGALIALAVIQSGVTVAISEGQKAKVLGAATYFAGDQDEEEDGGRRTAEVPGFATITCKACGRDFFPVPPDAVCPWCDTPYLTASYPADKAAKAS